MATAAFLRCMRRRDVASASFSAYRSLTGHAKSSWIGSHMGQNWGSLCRAFSSKPAESDVIGVDLGTTNSCVAFMKVKVSCTAADNQTQVGIKVLQGEGEMASDNKLLGEFELMDIPPASGGMQQIQVTVDIDDNGILTVSAKDKTTEKEQQITVRSSGGLSEDEMEKMVGEAELHAQRDQERKALIDIRNSGDTNIYSTEKSLGEYREKIPAEVAKEIEDAIADLRKAMGGDNVDEIKSKLDAANTAVSKIGQHMTGGGSHGGSPAGGSQGGEH